MDAARPSESAKSLIRQCEQRPAPWFQYELCEVVLTSVPALSVKGIYLRFTVFPPATLLTANTGAQPSTLLPPTGFPASPQLPHLGIWISGVQILPHSLTIRRVHIHALPSLIRAYPLHPRGVSAPVYPGQQSMRTTNSLQEAERRLLERGFLEGRCQPPESGSQTGAEEQIETCNLSLQSQAFA